MKWKLNDNGQVKNEEGLIVCTLPENPRDYESTLIQFAPEMFEAIMEFCGSLENTTQLRTPKKHYTRFQQILDNMIHQYK